jgi:aldose 1-epimerase
MIKEEKWHGLTIFTMENERMSVSLCPSLGNNLYRVWDKANQRDVLRVPENPEQVIEKAVHYGTPMMMPPNRIRHGKFVFKDKTYQFDVNPETGNHIHGVIKNLPWDIVSTDANDQQLSITSVFSTADHPDTMRQYPHPIHMEMTYTLSGSSVAQKLKATNRGSESAPFGFGLHTWFLLDGEPEKWTLELPVSSIWELDAENIPTGRLTPLGPYEHLQQGQNLKGLNLDTVFQVSERPNIAVLKKDNYEIRYSTNEEYKQWVIYTKGVADEFICLEPYTWVTNAPNLELDAELTGMRSIDSGQTLELEVILEVVDR